MTTKPNVFKIQASSKREVKRSMILVRESKREKS